MKEKIYYKKTKRFTEEKEFECDTHNIFLSFNDGLGKTGYFGSFEYTDKTYIHEDENMNQIFRDDLRVIQIKILDDRVEYYSAGRHTQGSCFGIKDIFEEYENVNEISRDMFFRRLKSLPLYQLF